MSVIVDKNIVVPLRDGIELRADIYRPAAAGRYPVLLQRTPYNKELWPITAMTLDPIRAAAAGYAVVIQDVRGRWTSGGGVFFPYRDELNDGYDSVAWAAEQPYSSGRIGCYGLSYMGATSWLAAASGHPALHALSPTTAPNDFWRDHFWRGGALNIGTLAMWAMRAIGPAALIRGRPKPAEFFPLLTQLIDDVDNFENVLRALPLNQFTPTRPDDVAFLPFFYEFLRHPVQDKWTASLLMTDKHSQVTAPSLSIAGWHDLLLAADLQHFRAMRDGAGSEHARRHSKLMIGPWAHGMFHSVVGDLDFGFRANGMFLDLKEDLTKLQLRWFDRWLKEERNGLDEESAVKLFVQGRNRWRDENDWPLARARATPWFLNGDASFSSRRTAMSTDARSFVYDPHDPCPTCGGTLLLPTQYSPGPVDQSALLIRRDVLQYTSSALSTDLEITGAVTAVLYVTTSGRDTDFIVKLCDVHPDGRCFNVCDGVLRLSFRDGQSRQATEPGSVVKINIDLWSTAMVFKAGHRLRVLVTSSDFPRYDRNPNTFELAHEATKLVPVLQQVLHTESGASHLVLPEIHSN
ncbi:MAG: CocE/NonD family hydrolase [Gammaproteobacteria bacterium]|nr:CocE/NonD family hydrolase [Gammaproteobacteria bacterium]